MEHSRNQRYVAVSLVLAFLGVALVAGGAYRTARRLATTAEWVEHGREVEGVLSQVVADLQDIEGGCRGYVLTGNERFLDSVHAATARLDERLATLQRLTADNPSQQRRVAALQPQVAQKVALSERLVDLRRREGMEAAAALVATEQGRTLTDKIHAVATEMDNEERQLLEVRSAALRASERNTMLAVGGFTAIALTLLLLVYLLVTRDITERKRAESHLRALLDAAPDATVVVDQAGRIVMVNAQMLAVFGYRREELLGVPVEVLMPDRFRDAHPRFRADYQAAPRTRPMGAGLQLYARTKDGREMPVEISLSPIQTDAGLLVTAAVRDITERKRAEDTLREASERIRDLYNQAPCGYHSLGPDGTFLEINDTELSWLGRTRDEVVGRMKFTDVVTPESVERFEREYPLFIRRGRVRDLEFEYVHRDGSVLPVLLNATAITDAAGRYLSSRATAIDMSERKRAETLAIERETLERTNRELQEFAYVASHDLQDPLRKIQAFGDRVRTKYADVLPREADDYLTRMQKAAARMQTLINDLLSFSRVTTRAQPFGPVDLAAIAREVISDLEGRLEQTHGRIELGPLPAIEADPTQMRQLLQNLLGNALKFHHPGQPPVVHVSGRLLNGAGPPPAGRTPPDAACEITVTDNGIGFDEKYLDRIFTIFQRLHGRDEYEGTGLGLAICRKIVERHHGHITARSTLGQGATFVVTLPVGQGGADMGDSGADRERRD